MLKWGGYPERGWEPLQRFLKALLRHKIFFAIILFLALVLFIYNTMDGQLRPDFEAVYSHHGDELIGINSRVKTPVTRYVVGENSRGYLFPVVEVPFQPKKGG